MSLKEHDRAILVIDMQNNLCDPEGSFARLDFDVASCVAAVVGCEQLVGAAHLAGVPVIYTRAEFLPDYADAGVVLREILDARLQASGALRAGTWETQIVANLTPMAADYVIPKNRSSAFYGTQLEPLLRSLGVDALVICGVSTSCCVESTARDAVERGYKVTVVRDATGELSPEMYEFTLDTLQEDFCRVADAAQIVAELQGG